MTDYTIAVFPGDGIGVEVMGAAMAVLEAVEARHGFTLDKQSWDGGAAYYRETGNDLPEGAFEAARAADAILFGAMGLPDVRLPDGTEVAPHLEMRRAFRLFAGVRPARKYPNTPALLADPRAEGIDLIVLRESTEGLFASRGRGTVEDGRVARDTMEITRETSEDLFDFAFGLARRRAEKGRGQRTVTCVDKSNVFVSMAFFRSIFDERAAQNSDVTASHAYVDAAALDLVRKPWAADVLVMENMFGDILSDLCGGLVGGMGMAPCAEIGTDHALFQPAHGSAPDIAGKGISNPTAMLVSTAMMLDWIGERAGDARLVEAGDSIDRAVWQAYADGAILPYELGGTSDTRAVTEAVIDALR
ncbi:3-isopropylmalate dehydrogenase [Acuticoccus sediminis]|uniref:3-isopropylmalate dehydrogenase n=1 Tax=Acuticoccus sediminis TaxID=2184697 RepID=A0A8B2NQE9_9HYPH|nr:isocitrate/isopropylmalate family dehydrogenase [Acuticoccus sediminis]RAH97229.1 3-isopropylmalate dehydrogenase [Acuticoccus sediminis]